MFGTVVRCHASTSIAPSALSATPISASPRPAVFGLRPVAYMTRSAEISWPWVVDRVAVRKFLDPRNLATGVDLDAAVAHLLRQGDPDIVIKTVKQLLAADDLDNLGAEAAKDAGEFDRYIAAADNHDPARQLGQIERLVRRDDMLDAGQLGRGRMAAGGDHDVVGGVAAAVDLDRMRVDNDGASLDQRDIGVFQQRAIDAFESVELL